MAKRGPQKTPTKILKLRGSWLAATRADEPAPEIQRPRCPSWLPEEAKKEFRRAAKLLLKQGILTKWDYPCLVLYAKAWAEWREADLAVKGLFVKTVNGNIVQHPALSIRNRAWERVLKGAREFGFSPASRASLASVNPEGAAPAEDKEKFFKGTG